MDTNDAIRSLFCGALLATWTTIAGAAEFLGPIVSVLDGDTIEVLNDHHTERIRLSSIDCTEKGQAYGQHATSDLALGKEVTVQTHGYDKYKRTIAHVPLLYLTRGRDTPWDLCELDW